METLSSQLLLDTDNWQQEARRELIARAAVEAVAAVEVVAVEAAMKDPRVEAARAQSIAENLGRGIQRCIIRKREEAEVTL